MRVGLVAAIPFFFVGFYKITPAIPAPSRKILLVYLPLVVGLHIAGLVFVYYIMLPRGVGFLLTFGDDFAVPLITINSIFDLMKGLFFWVPIAFQLPVIMHLLAKSGILTYKRLMRFRKIRKIIPLGLALFSAVITPTVDHVNFLIMWIPMLLLFEVGMFLMWWQNREEGNYLWVHTIGHAIGWMGKPFKPFRWVYRKIRRR